MISKVKTKRLRRHITGQLFLGLAILLGVLCAAVHSDLASTRKMMADTTSYIKEQCNRYARIELAAETKSLMRMIESCRQISGQIAGSKNGIGEELLREYARDNYVSGILLLDAEGNIVSQYHAEREAPEGLAAYLDSPALLDTALYPEKRYAVRFYCPDKSEVDLAAVQQSGREGILVAYYHTSAEYLESFSLSISSLLSGYSLENSGTIVVSSGDTIEASNDASLIGSRTDDLAILRKIQSSAYGNQLTHAPQEEGSVARYFGLMERGRDFYVYSFLPGSRVFSNTPRIMLYAVIAYVIIQGAIEASRWRTAQRYREEQLEAQREYAKKLQNTNEQLSAAVDQADRANAAKTSFLSKMSHDIRTPLNGIIGLLEIDAAHPDNIALMNANRAKMRIAASHLLSLINDILQMSKLESGEIILAHEPLNLNRLSQEIFTIIDQRAAESGITMEQDDRSEPVVIDSVLGSPLHLRQIFLNIYTNCIKYNKIGGKVRTCIKCLGTEDGIVTYQWRISDTGIGMSPEFLARIFDPFAQERSDARSVYQGTGLGMTIVKGLIEKMQGTIEISSEEGVGSVFTITLPFEIASASAETFEEPAVQESSIQGVRLMLAEDNELNAEIAETLLTDQGAAVTIVNNGAQAVQLFQASPSGTFDAILMDVMMPVMDGLTASVEIRALERPDAKSIPIIAMTANAFEEDARKCIEAGMNAHLAKPLQIEKVKATISREVSKKI